MIGTRSTPLNRAGRVAYAGGPARARTRRPGCLSADRWFLHEVLRQRLVEQAAIDEVFRGLLDIRTRDPPECAAGNPGGFRDRFPAAAGLFSRKEPRRTQ